MSTDVSDVVSLGTVAPASRDTVDVVLVADPAEWDALVALAPWPHLPQSYGYGEGKRATGWTVRRASFRIGGRVVAIATVLERHVAGLRLVSRVNRGPIMLEAAPAASTVVGVHAALRRGWRGPLLIAPALVAGEPSRNLLRAAGFRQRQSRGWHSGIVRLDRDIETIWAGVSSGFRNRVRNAVKAGAQLHIAEDHDTYAWMLERHVENMRAKKFTAADPTLLMALRAAAPGAVSVFQLLHRGQAVAGMSVVSFGRRAEYHIGWFGQKGRELNAGNFLMWEIIKEMQRRGVTEYDLGGMRAGDGYTRFKRTMKPVEYQLAGEWWSI